MSITKNELRKIAAAVYDKFSFVADQFGKKEFIIGRVKLAIAEGAKTYDEIFEIAVNSPLLKPNIHAIQVARENMHAYLEAMGGTGLQVHYDEILRLVTLYHQHKLYGFVRDEEKKRAAGYPIPKKEVDTWRGLSSEMYHLISHDFDWDAIASFIIDDTNGQGNGLELEQLYGPGSLVYKAILPTACKTCIRLYQNADGTPKLFNIGAILQNGAATIRDRITEKAKSKLPTCGPSHLYCSCSLNSYTGYEHWAQTQA